MGPHRLGILRAERMGCLHVGAPLWDGKGTTCRQGSLLLAEGMLLSDTDATWALLTHRKILLAGQACYFWAGICYLQRVVLLAKRHVLLAEAALLSICFLASTKSQVGVC